MSETAYQRIGREQRERQEARALRMAQGNKPGRRRPRKPAAPAWGTQEWAETRGDDLGESHD